MAAAGPVEMRTSRRLGGVPLVEVQAVGDGQSIRSQCPGKPVLQGFFMTAAIKPGGKWLATSDMGVIPAK